MAGNTQYRNKWAKDNLDRINLTVPKGQKAELQAHAKQHGESLNAFIKRAIHETIERERRVEETASQENISLEDAQISVQIMDALSALEPVIADIRDIYKNHKITEMCRHVKPTGLVIGRQNTE